METRGGRASILPEPMPTAPGYKHFVLRKGREELPAETIMDRFLFCGEGRIDHLRGYLDGLES